MPVAVIPELIQGAKDVLSGLISGTLRQVHGKQVISFDIEIDRFISGGSVSFEQLSMLEGVSY